MNTLEKRFKSVITGNVEIFCDMIAGTDLATKACTDITIEFAKSFCEWATNKEYIKTLVNNKWLNVNDTKTYTTDKLITTYINTLK